MKIRIATRGSQLALAQTGQVAETIRAARPDVETELVTISTRGDRQRGPLAAVGGKGLFTRELEDALRCGDVDLAVHSAKDMPADMEPDFAIAAVPDRQDARDVLASRRGALADLPPGASVGTGSLRRRAQLLAARPDLKILAIRGNVETRMSKALGEAAELDAVVLAAAGLHRAGLSEANRAHLHPLAVEQVIPAASQGLLALQTLTSRGDLAQLLSAIEDADSRAAVEAERAVVRGLGAGCQSCLAVYVHPTQAGTWEALGMAARPDGSDMIRAESVGDSAQSACELLLANLLEQGAAALLDES